MRDRTEVSCGREWSNWKSAATARLSVASIGEVSRDLKYAGEPTRVEVAIGNRIRESVTIHREFGAGRWVDEGG